MEALLAVEREVDKVLSKFGGINDHFSKTVQELIDHIENMKTEFENCPSGYELTEHQVTILKQIVDKIHDTVHYLATDHRDLHSTVSKVGKSVDRNFIADFSACSKEIVYNDNDNINLLNQVICQHFYRQGMLDIAQCLAKEAGVNLEEGQVQPFQEINKILESLRLKEIEPALKWAETNRVELESKDSSLEFKLHRLRFITIIQQGVEYQSQAIDYARTHFMYFAKKYEKEIQNLMGMFLYIPQGITSSPYAHYLEPTLWAEIADVFVRDACSLLGFSIDSPLSVSINAGCQALPALLNIKQVMQQRQVSGMWNGKDELPIEIDIGQGYQYHSIFACPILRQQSSESNPPMRLVCGHAISKDALNKLSNSVNKLKCPYCPMEQSTTDAKQLFF